MFLHGSLYLSLSTESALARPRPLRAQRAACLRMSLDASRAAKTDSIRFLFGEFPRNTQIVQRRVLLSLTLDQPSAAAVSYREKNMGAAVDRIRFLSTSTNIGRRMLHNSADIHSHDNA